MNTVTNAERSYYTANVNGKTEKGPCAAMTPYGVIGPERVNQGVTFLLHYLDDFLTVGQPGTTVCQHYLHLLIEVCRVLGIPLGN